MKTKFSYLTLSVMALLLVFSGCSNSEDGETVDNTKAKSVLLKLGKSTPTTHSVGAPIVDGDDVILHSGNLYFVNASGAILKHYTITSSQPSATNINMTDALAGTPITNLPGNTDRVYVVGNTSGLPTSGNISTVQDFLSQVTSQHDIEDVNLYGSGGLVPPISPLTAYTCTVDLKPTVARIELTDITAASTSVITGFDVDGIFVDNYYSQASVGGSVDVDDFVENGAFAAKFNNLTTQYPVGLKPAIYDFYDPALSASTRVAKPAGTGTVWGYNLFASATGSAVPRVIIRLSSIATNDQSVYPSPQFITIKGLKAVSGGASLTGIKSGEVYRIAAGALTFKETDLSPIPNLNLMDIEVTVNLVDWTVVGVTPEL